MGLWLRVSGSLVDLSKFGDLGRSGQRRFKTRRAQRAVAAQSCLRPEECCWHIQDAASARKTLQP